ncbi:MAG: aldo/keto reductase [Candidatus Aminicenantales bacterium]|jgi:aryl-alcohol dehydrogenase-like predicted oxidoreductase
MTFNEPAVLGRTGLKVGRLGLASGYGAPAAAVLEAFERGCNYWTWGTVIKGFSAPLREAIKTVVARRQRDRLVLAMFTYAHQRGLTEHFLHKGLKSAGLDHADVLILGYFSKRPSARLIEGALDLKKRGLVRFIGLSGHNRKLFAALAGEGVFDVFHLRYSAAHRGAETETFPFIRGDNRPGVVSFTATKNGKLLSAKKRPPGEAPVTAADCYRFVLSHPAVDVCMMGTKSLEQMRENLKVLESGPMSADELARMRRLGDFVHGRRS